MRSVAVEIKWEVISSQVLEPDLVRVLVGPMVSAAHISARIEKRHFSQRRATPSVTCELATLQHPPLLLWIHQLILIQMFSLTGTKLSALEQINAGDLFPFFAIHTWRDSLKVSDGIYGPALPVLIISV